MNEPLVRLNYISPEYFPVLRIPLSQGRVWDQSETVRGAPVAVINQTMARQYWPKGDAPPDDTAWEQSVVAFQNDLQAMQGLVADPASDLFAPIPHGQGQTILREALLVADHNAYHLGQLVIVRRLLGAWADDG